MFQCRGLENQTNVRFGVEVFAGSVLTDLNIKFSEWSAQLTNNIEGIEYQNRTGK